MFFGSVRAIEWSLSLKGIDMGTGVGSGEIVVASPGGKQICDYRTQVQFEIS